MISNAIRVLVGLFVLGAPIWAQQLDEVAVEKAIKAGQDNKFGPLISECKAGPGAGERFSASADVSFGVMRVHPIGRYRVVMSTNVGRIAFLAAEAKRLKEPFGVRDVSGHLRNAAVHVFVDPDKPPTRDWGGGIPLPAPIDRVVIRSKSDPASVVEPETVNTEDVTWDDRTGIVFGVGADGRLEKRPLMVERSRATATFAIGPVTTLRAGDLEIVVITKAGERRCAVSARDRLRLLS